jgi:hypothetical protein
MDMYQTLKDLMDRLDALEYRLDEIEAILHGGVDREPDYEPVLGEDYEAH